MRCVRYLVFLLALVGAALLLATPAAFARQSDRDPEAVSALGRLLFSKPEGGANEAAYAAVATARTALERVSSDREFRRLALELGTLLDGVWRYREAVSVYSRALSRFPGDGEFFLRRGVSALRLRNFDRAQEDLRRAVRLGAQDFESRYRLGLSQFVLGDYRRAVKTFNQAVDLASSADERIAAMHWEYSSARRSGRRDDADAVLASVPRDMAVDDNSDYLVLMRMYLGQTSEYVVFNQDADASERSSLRGFGVGNWHLTTGGQARAREIFALVALGADWPSIGVIAAEAELQRIDE